MRRVGPKSKRTKVDDADIDDTETSINEDDQQENGSNEDVPLKQENGEETQTTKTPSRKKKAEKSKKTTSAKKAKKAVKEAVDDDDDEEEEEYEVEAIVDSRYLKGKRQYKVRWRGHGPEEDSWCGEADLHCEELINEYLESQGSGESGESAKSKKKAGDKKKSAKNKDDDDDTEYEVDKVLDVKFKKNGTREFLIHWKGFAKNYDSWEPEENLNCADLIEKLMSKLEKVKETSAKELRTKPKQTERLAFKSPGMRTSRRTERPSKK